MNETLERAEADAERPRGIPRFLSCLVKGPLGCLFFAIGAVGMVVLLLPPALGRVVDHATERWFTAHYAGHLELGDAWVGSVYDSQRVERLILRDPNGDEILRGSLSAPPLAEALDHPSHHFGPVVLRIDLLHLVESEDGTTNLERAFEELPSEEESDTERRASTDLDFLFSIQVTVARLRTTSARGKTTELSNLDFHGTFEWGREETRLVLEGGSDPTVAEPLHVRAEFSRPEYGRRRPWKCALAMEGVPTVLARAPLCAAARPFAALAGPRIDTLSWSEDDTEVALLFEDEGTRFELLGKEQDGLVTGPRDSVLTATLPCANASAQALLATLLPLVASLECVDPTRSHELRLADYVWPLDGDWSRLAGELELDLAPARCVLPPQLGERLGELAPFDELHLRMHLGDGVLECSQLEYPLAGGALRVGGTIALADGETELTVTMARGGAGESLTLAGTRDALTPVSRELPEPPTPPAGGVPTPPGEKR